MSAAGTGAEAAPVLSADQQKQLDALKIKTKIENERYLRSHPEVAAMLAEFTRQALHEKPDDVRQFAAGFFTDPNLRASTEALLAQQKAVHP